MWRTSPMQLLLGPLWPGEVVPIRVLSMDQKELFNHLTMGKQMTVVKLNCWCLLAILEAI